MNDPKDREASGEYWRLLRQDEEEALGDWHLLDNSGHLPNSAYKSVVRRVRESDEIARLRDELAAAKQQRDALMAQAADTLDEVRAERDAAKARNAELERKLKEANQYGSAKNTTATTFMNQVKKLQAEVAWYRQGLEQMTIVQPVGTSLPALAAKYLNTEQLQSRPAEASGEYWRLLNEGEPIHEGDEYRNEHGKWKPLKGIECDGRNVCRRRVRESDEIARLRDELKIAMGANNILIRHNNELAALRKAFDEAITQIEEVRKAMTDSAPFMTTAGIELLKKLEAFLAAHPATAAKEPPKQEPFNGILPQRAGQSKVEINCRYCGSSGYWDSAERYCGCKNGQPDDPRVIRDNQSKQEPERTAFDRELEAFKSQHPNEIWRPVGDLFAMVDKRLAALEAGR